MGKKTKKSKPQKIVRHKVKKSTKKKFFDVTTPLVSTKVQLYAASQEDLNGRVIKIDLTKNLRGKSLELKLKIKSDEKNMEALPQSLELAGSYIKRVMRKSTDYVEDSFEAETKDQLTRIKPLLITRKRVSRAVLNALRVLTNKHLTAHLKTRTSNEIFEEIMTNKLQKQLSLKLKKIYPLALCEIRVFKVLGALKKKAEKKEDSKKE